MFERFTTGAIKAIMLAQEEARRLGHNWVGTEHILLGLIGQGDLRRRFASYGMSLAAARTHVERIRGRANNKIPVEIPFTPAAKQFLEHTWEVAKARGDNYIGVEHMFDALMTKQSPTIIEILNAFEIEPEAIHSDLAEQLAYLEKERVVDERKSRKGFSLMELALKVLGRNSKPSMAGESEDVLALTVRLSKELGRGYQASDHLLLALSEYHNPAQEFLEERGVTAPAVRTEIAKLVTATSQDGADRLQTDAMRHAVLIAIDECQNEKSEKVMVRHLLIGLLKLESGIATEILDTLNVDRAESLQALRQ